MLPKGTDTGNSGQSKDPCAAHRRLRHSLGVAEGPTEIPHGLCTLHQSSMDNLTSGDEVAQGLSQ